MANLFDDVFSEPPEMSGVDLRVVVFKSNDKWTARCLDYDLMAENEYSSDALDDLTEVVISKVKEDAIAGIIPLSKVDKPAESFLQWVQAEGKKEIVCFCLTLLAVAGKKPEVKSGPKTWN